MLFVLATLMAFCLSYGVRRYALARSILDHPNQRSSHQKPVPIGGGIAIVITVLGICAWLGWLGIVPRSTVIALLGGGAAVSIIGWIDDRYNGVGASWRFIVHVAGAIWALFWLGGLQHIRFGSAELNFGLLPGAVLAVLGIVWCINFFNFMDGIDGIAAGEAVTVAMAATLLITLKYGQSPTATLALLVAGASTGFLIWNWAPAKLFMGDVGSGFLGFVFAVLALSSEREGTLPLVAWIILAGVFLVDSTATLVRRIWGQERWYAAHRSHAYQRMVSAGYSHRSVTTTVLALNIVLALITFFAFSSEQRTAPGAVAAFILLCAAYLLVERINPMRQRQRVHPENSSSPT